MDRFDCMTYAAENGAEAASGLLMMVGPEGFVGDYAAMENELSGMVESQKAKAATMQEYRGKWEANRETVQQFLDSVRESRKAEAARQEAEKQAEAARQEAAAAEARREADTSALIREINFKSAFSRTENTVSERNTRREMEQAARRADTRKRKRRAAENWRVFILRTFIFCLIGEIAWILCDVGTMPLYACMAVLLWSGTCLVLNYLSFTDWSLKEYKLDREGVTV